MGFKWFNPCQPCCGCPTVGYEQNILGSVYYCCPPHYNAIVNLFVYEGNALREQLNKCRCVFMGPVGICGFSTMFSEAQWEIIGDWVYDGGRLYCAGEYVTCIDGVVLDRINDFLASIGTSMSFGREACDCGCSSNWTGVLNTSVGMLENVSAIYHACTNKVNGGTWLAKINGGAGVYGSCDPEQFAYIAIESVGEGWVIAVGDSNTTSGCGYNNCALFSAFIETANEDMI